MLEFREAELRSDLLLYMVSRCRGTAKAAADSGEAIAAQALSMFYGSYSPKFYNRTGNLTSSYSRYYKDNGSVVYGGVRIHSDNMSEYTHGSYSSHKVASITWLNGAHGWENITTPPYLIASANFISLLPSFDMAGIQFAHSQGYSVLQF